MSGVCAVVIFVGNKGLLLGFFKKVKLFPGNHRQSVGLKVLRFVLPEGWMPGAGKEQFPGVEDMCAAGQWNSTDQKVAEFGPLPPW